MRVLFTGGGSGGHVFPLVAIAREIRRIYTKNDLEFYYIGASDDFGLILLSQEDFQIKKIVGGKIRRYFSFQNIVDIIFKIPFGVIQSFFLLLLLKPGLVFSKGGSGSIAVTFAARMLKIPVFIHESDVVPGLSNQKTSKWARKIFVSFEKTEFFDVKKTIVAGNPIRSELLSGDRNSAVEIFDLSLTKPIILFLGGSQGAEPINDFVLRIINELLSDYEVIHMTGRENAKEISAEALVVEEKDLAKYYHPVGFLNEEKMKQAYAAADLVVSRSGSGSIFEVAALGKPSILIPLPTSAGDHQAKNAFAYADTGAALVMEQQNLVPNLFMQTLKLLFAEPDRLNKMHAAAEKFAKPLAARAIAREILEFLMLDFFEK